MSDPFSSALLSEQNPLSVVLFNHVAVKPDWKFINRNLDTHNIYFLKSGCLELIIHPIEGVELISKKSSGPALIWVPPGVRHTVQPIPGIKLPVQFNLRFTLGTGAQHFDHDFLLLRKVPHLQPLIDLLHAELQQDLPCGEDSIRPYLAILYQQAITSHHKDEIRAISLAKEKSLYAYHNQHMSEWPTVSDLAAHIDLTPDYFSRVFKRTFGKSPKTWMVEQRVYQGARLLSESNAPLKAIAEELGYKEIYSFSRQFKQVMRRTPSQWRKEMK